MKTTIREELSSDLFNGCMPVGEIESCLNHWDNKYEIVRKAEFLQLKEENERLKAEIEKSRIQGVLTGLKICKEMWAQGTISHENIYENEVLYKEELESLTRKEK